jgi:hypothetical protein
VLTTNIGLGSISGPGAASKEKRAELSLRSKMIACQTGPNRHIDRICSLYHYYSMDPQFFKDSLEV